MKTCSMCHIKKSIKEFSFRDKKKNRLTSNCKKCQKIYRDAHYIANKSIYIARAIRQKKELRNWFIQYKSKLKCSHCGFNHPAVLQFHHTKDNKEMAVSDAIRRGFNKEKIIAEIEKCEVLCANCHFIEHFAGVV